MANHSKIGEFKIEKECLENQTYLNQDQKVKKLGWHFQKKRQQGWKN